MALDHAHAPAVSSMPAPAERDERMPRLTLSPGFIRSMQSGWGAADRTPRLGAGAAEAAAAHRARLSAALPGRRLAVGSGRAPMRANDSAYEFRANSDFLWLVGVAIEDAVIVLEPVAGGHDATLYLPAPSRPGDDGFFGSALHGELWVGPMPGLAEYADALDVRTRPIAELAADAATLCAGAGVLDEPRSAELARVLSELRMFKDDWEVAELRAAIDGTVGGFAATVAEIPDAVRWGGERWLQGTFDRHARTVGNGVGYTTVVGSGAHAPILHWMRADGAVDPEALLLLDVSVDEALSADGQQHRRYIVCGVGHHLGIDVHDCASSSYAAYQGAQMQEGMVLTVEPGLYFHSFDETVPPELRGIGVRLEDDLLVTAGGAEVLSDALPIDADGIEAWMAGLDSRDGHSLP